MAKPPHMFEIPATLSAPERLLLAQQLLGSVLAESLPLSDAQIAEVRKRSAALDAGQASAEPWADVKARLLRPE